MSHERKTHIAVDSRLCINNTYILSGTHFTATRIRKDSFPCGPEFLFRRWNIHDLSTRINYSFPAGIFVILSISWKMKNKRIPTEVAASYSRVSALLCLYKNEAVECRMQRRVLAESTLTQPHGYITRIAATNWTPPTAETRAQLPYICKRSRPRRHRRSNTRSLDSQRSSNLKFSIVNYIWFIRTMALIFIIGNTIKGFVHCSLEFHHYAVIKTHPLPLRRVWWQISLGVTRRNS